MTPGKTPLTLDPAVLQGVVDGAWAGARRRIRELSTDPALHLPVDGTLEELRAHTTAAVRPVADSGLTRLALPVEQGGTGRHAEYLAGFEELVTASPSLQIKAGVQFGLFGGAIMHLGNSDQHEKWLLPALDGELMGSFAMTEIGHGSDVAEVGTTATYDAASREFVVHTPFRAATKEYIGNAARDAQAAVVFAQLITQGVNHGVHAFYVPIRDEAGDPLPGITIEDDGKKGGLPGVDNGRFAFDEVRVPRENLLTRYGAVTEEGEYSSPIESPGRRFFTMLGTLVQGRVSLDGAAVVASKLALDIAVRYAHDRRQFTTSSPVEETRLIDYQRHQRRLMPLIAQTYADAISHDTLLHTFDAVFSGEDETTEGRELLETQAAGFKALTTWNALDTIQEAREACGGAGYMAENRLVGLHADMDVYVTFEGDNTVLLQLVGKRLLTDYAKELKDIDFGGAARLIGAQAAEHTLYRTGFANVGRTIGDLVTASVNDKRVRSGKVQEALLRDRVETMVASVAQKLRGAQGKDQATGARIFNETQNELVEAAIAYIELLKWQGLNDEMHRVEDEGSHPEEAKILRRIRDLFGLTLLERHMGWHLMHGRLPMARARRIGPTIDALCAKLAQNSLDLVTAFGYGPDHRRAPIADGAEAQRQGEARAYYRAARAKSDWPVEEKELRRRAARR
ncbi:acyl-CoA dehydrogenase family protein [Brevibacterium senegalense]|uniref:acyl-CoA dehydrogenase family protein n=1 Tax=Brevibacterium senegalense TaxID=1033736 RepID=UPI0002EDF68D|nr:acyl-CoA dehydrogenase family protein [Brevibacterium senegalense]